MKLTVSIVLHQTDPVLIESVMHSLEKEPVSKVYVVDNSPDDRLHKVVGRFDNSEYLHIPNNGYGAAHNVAIRKAAGEGSDYHLVLNPDVRWFEPILNRLVDVMKADKNIALIQPRILNANGTLLHTCRLLPTPWDVFGKRFLPKSLFKSRLNRYLLPNYMYDREFNAVYMQGSFMLFDTKKLVETGLFDERFFMYPEDIDITRRIRRRYSAHYYPQACVIHDHAAMSQRFGRMMWIHIVNMARYFNKYGWFCDKERRTMNRQLLETVEKLKDK